MQQAELTATKSEPSDSLLQQQNVIDQQKQMFQSQRALLETSMDSAIIQPGHASGGDWQEEIHHKIKALKDSYFSELNAMYERIAVKLQQHDALAQQPKSDQIDKLRVYKRMLECLLSVMQCPKTELNPTLRDKMDQYEKQIVNLINMNRSRKPGEMQLNQIHPHHMSSVQPQQSQSQMSQVSCNENEMSPQMQTSMSLQNQVQPSSMGSMQQQQEEVGVVSVQKQNSVSLAQQTNISSQSGLNMLQPNVNNLQTNMNMLQNQNLKPHREQQFKKMMHRKMMLQKQQVIKQQSILSNLQAEQLAPQTNTIGLQQQQQPKMMTQQNVIDQQNQVFQSQRDLPEILMDSATSQPGHASGGDWQEEIYQKIKALKDSYFSELNAMYQRIAVKLQQHDAQAQQPKSDQIDKLRVYKKMLELLLSVMQCPKTELNPTLRYQMDQYEKQIVNLINMNKSRKPGAMQQNQIHSHHMSSLQSQSQMSQVSCNENEMSPQMQNINESTESS